MISRDDALVATDQTDPDRGRLKAARPNARLVSPEPRPVVTAEDITATRVEIDRWKSLTRRS